MQIQGAGFKLKLCKGDGSGMPIEPGDVVGVKLLNANCEHTTAELIVHDVATCGNGFFWDRTLPGQDYRPEDIDSVLPEHDCKCPDDDSSSSSAGSV